MNKICQPHNNLTGNPCYNKGSKITKSKCKNKGNKNTKTIQSNNKDNNKSSSCTSQTGEPLPVRTSDYEVYLYYSYQYYLHQQQCFLHANAALARCSYEERCDFLGNLLYPYVEAMLTPILLGHEQQQQQRQQQCSTTDTTTTTSTNTTTTTTNARQKKEYAEKITGMILELDDDEILFLLSSQPALVERVHEGYSLLISSNATAAAPPAAM